MELIEAHKQKLYKTAWSYLRNEDDVADAIQETILNCYENIDKLKNSSYFTTWMTRILINNCKDILQRKKREMPNEVMPEQGEFCRDLENYEFEELIRSMDEKYRLVLLLYYGEGFKIREIAQILEMDENTVKTSSRKERNLWVEIIQNRKCRRFKKGCKDSGKGGIEDTGNIASDWRGKSNSNPQQKWKEGLEGGSCGCSVDGGNICRCNGCKSFLICKSCA